MKYLKKYWWALAIVILLLAVWFFMGKGNAPDVPNPDAWMATYRKKLSGVQNATGSWKEDIAEKAEKRGVSLAEMQHRDAVYLTNKEHDTAVDGKTWHP